MKIVLDAFKSVWQFLLVSRESALRQTTKKMTTTQIEAGTKTSTIKGKKLVDGNGHGGRKLYTVPGEYNSHLLICLKGEVIEVVSDLAKQDQRIRQGW